MLPVKSPSFAHAARVLLDRIKVSLEASHANEFFALEPVSGRYYFGSTLSEAVGSARREDPDRLAHPVLFICPLCRLRASCRAIRIGVGREIRRIARYCQRTVTDPQ